jgi:hypothetical protein
MVRHYPYDRIYQEEEEELGLQSPTNQKSKKDGKTTTNDDTKGQQQANDRAVPKSFEMAVGLVIVKRALWLRSFHVHHKSEK